VAVVPLPPHKLVRPPCWYYRLHEIKNCYFWVTAGDATTKPNLIIRHGAVLEMNHAYNVLKCPLHRYSPCCYVAEINIDHWDSYLTLISCKLCGKERLPLVATDISGNVRRIVNTDTSLVRKTWIIVPESNQIWKVWNLTYRSSGGLRSIKVPDAKRSVRPPNCSGGGAGHEFLWIFFTTMSPCK
jgi:hypothetical protein